MKGIIIITVYGGVVQYVEKSHEGIEVEVHDYDTDGFTKEELKETSVDDSGDRFVRSSW